MIERSGDDVCDLHHTCEGDEKRGFFWFSLKMGGDGLSVV
jgi:hypothetical protein